jgi:hypothetical protein
MNFQLFYKKNALENISQLPNFDYICVPSEFCQNRVQQGTALHGLRHNSQRSLRSLFQLGRWEK